MAEKMMEVCVIDDGSPTSESSITISLPSIHIQDDVDVVCQCETKSTSEDDCDEMVLTKTESTSSVVARFDYDNGILLMG